MIEDKMAARLGWAIPAVTITLSTLVHAVSGNARAIPFFISEGDHPGLERWIFTAGLAFSGLVLMWVSWRLFQVKREGSRWYWIHLSLIAGLWVGGNLTIMSFMDMYDHPEMHIITALNVFHFGLAWGVLAHLAVKDGNPTGKKLRMASILIAFTSFWIMTWAMGNAFEENPEALKPPLALSEVQNWIDYAAPAEYLLVVGFILTLASFEKDFDSDEEEE